MPHTLLLIVTLLLTHLSSAGETVLQANSADLQPYKLVYTASYNGMPINAVRQLKQLDDNSYHLQTTAANFMASITEQGRFSLDDKGALRHKNYQYKRSVFGKKKTEKLVYDHKNNVANYTSKDKHRQVSLDTEHFNRLSYQVQLRRDLINHCELLEYSVISHGRLKTYRFERLGEETLETPLGSINAIKIRRVREDNDRETVLWFAPQLNHLLVKLWQREKDGAEYQIVLKEGHFGGQPLTITEPAQ